MFPHKNASISHVTRVHFGMHQSVSRRPSSLLELPIGYFGYDKKQAKRFLWLCTTILAHGPSDYQREAFLCSRVPSPTPPTFVTVAHIKKSSAGQL